jgi:hypothetical protein
VAVLHSRHDSRHFSPEVSFFLRRSRFVWDPSGDPAGGRLPPLITKNQIWKKGANRISCGPICGRYGGVNHAGYRYRMFDLDPHGRSRGVRVRLAYRRTRSDSTEEAR